MNRTERLAALSAEMTKRILILDGSMGAYLQGFGLTTNDFHGTRFVEHPMSLKGDTDILTLTQPAIITQIHEGYLAAGADIISTNTFTANPVSQAEYALEELVYEINIEAARLARAACDVAEAADGRPRAVAGAMGPTTKLLSILKPEGVVIATTWPRNLILRCAQIRGQKDHLPWQDGLAVSFLDTEQALAAYDRGEYCHSPVGGGDLLAPSFFGETCISKKYVMDHWTNRFRFVDYIDDPRKCAQNVIVVRK